MGSSDKAPDIESGRSWWRFSKYEVRDGYLWPVEGAPLTRYDPREDARGGYQSLTRLVEQVSPRRDDDGTLELDADEEGALVAWAEDHGLLGILPHRVLTVTVATGGRSGTRGEWGPSEYQYVRTPSRWVQHLPAEVVRRVRGGYRYRKLALYPEDDLRGVAKAVRPQRVSYRSNLRRSRALVADLDTGAVRSESLSWTWRRFFPGMRQDTFNVPLTDDFWRAYCEPVSDFLDAALRLRQAIDRLRIQSAPALRLKGMQELSALAAPTGLVLTEEDGRARQRWGSPSLLATFARMAIEDLCAGARPIVCETCGRLSLRKVKTTRYCGRTCRLTTQKRRNRRRRREKAASAAKR